jgi:hypothetical protein
MGFPPMMSGVSGNGFPPFIGPHAVMGSGWNGPGGYGGEDRARAGPIRRGYNRPNNRSTPYDRRPGDNRDARYGGGQGHPGDPRGGRLGGGAGRWGDGAGVAAVGPREAVQGRSLKSYEDLDAVGGGGGSELNY